LATLPFIVAEMYLRSTGFVDTADLSHDPIFFGGDQAQLFVLNPDSRRFEIPESRSNFFRPASFAAQKPSGTRRVFVLGGSTVQGRPYETETAFPRWLAFRLQAGDPAHAYEVINCGGVSYASYRVARVLDEVLQHAPDAIVIYSGHNEFLEQRSYPEAFARRRSWAASLADRSHLVGALREFAAPAEFTRQPLPSTLTTRLDLVDGMKHYVRDDASRAAVVRHYGITMRRMLSACRDAGVPVVVCMPASEIVETPPFKLQTRTLPAKARARFERHWATARDGSVSPAERLRSCGVCLAIDPEHAGAHFIAGRLHRDQGDASAARRHLVAARDHDVCPLRATTPIMQQLSAACEAFGQSPVRCDRLLDTANASGLPIPDGIPDPDLFVDHVHPTIEGHQRIARSLADRLYQVLAITPDPAAQSEYERLVTEHWRGLDETYFARGKQRLEGLRNWAAGRAGKLSLPETGDRDPAEQDAAEAESPR
jgi:lysophospholipase L1-like esterase